jgi:hypothetical protein
MAMPNTASTPGVATRAPYKVAVHHMECCNCSHGCNCQFEGYPNAGKCEFLIGWQVIEGRFGAIVLDGVRFIVAAMYPKAIHEGNGRVVLFVDAKARQDQVQAIAAILSGQAGGMPWEAIAGTVASFKGPVVKPIEMTVNGTKSSFSVPGVLEVVQTPILDAVSGEEKEVHITYPKGGFMWNDGSICTTSAMRLQYEDMAFDHKQHYASYAKAQWTNQ